MEVIYRIPVMRIIKLYQDGQKVAVEAWGLIQELKGVIWNRRAEVHEGAGMKEEGICQCQVTGTSAMTWGEENANEARGAVGGREGVAGEVEADAER